MLKRLLRTILCRPALADAAVARADGQHPTIPLSRRPPTARRTLSLPVELWLLVCAHLNYHDLLRLGGVSSSLRAVVGRPYVGAHSFRQQLNLPRFLLARKNNSVVLHPILNAVEFLAIDARGRRTVKFWRAARPTALDALGPVLDDCATSPSSPRLFIGDVATLRLLRALYPGVLDHGVAVAGGARVHHVLHGILDHAVLRLPHGSRRRRAVRVQWGYTARYMRVCDAGDGWVGLLVSP